MFVSLQRTPVTDGLTEGRIDRRTDGQNYDSQDRVSITASRGKKCTKFDFGCMGWAPSQTSRGAYSAPQIPQLHLRGLLLKRSREGKGKQRNGREGGRMESPTHYFWLKSCTVFFETQCYMYRCMSGCQTIQIISYCSKHRMFSIINLPGEIEPDVQCQQQTGH